MRSDRRPGRVVAFLFDSTAGFFVVLAVLVAAIFGLGMVVGRLWP